MPRDGSLILSNSRGPTLALVRRGVSPSWALQLDEIDGAAGGIRRHLYRWQRC